MSTTVMVGIEIGIKDIKKSYFFINNSYYELSEKEKDFCYKIDKYKPNKIYQYIESSTRISFIGDSIIEGTIMINIRDMNLCLIALKIKK